MEMPGFIQLSRLSASNTPMNENQHENAVSDVSVNKTNMKSRM